ncbi:hypothetical protein SCUCBS95973_007347, partial [Sporothrix curviconia]
VERSTPQKYNADLPTLTSTLNGALPKETYCIGMWGAGFGTTLKEASTGWVVYTVRNATNTHLLYLLGAFGERNKQVALAQFYRAAEYGREVATVAPGQVKPRASYERPSGDRGRVQWLNVPSLPMPVMESPDRLVRIP